MRHVGKVLGIIGAVGAVGAGTAAVARVVRTRAHRAAAEKSVEDRFAALPRLAPKGGLAAYDSAGSRMNARNDNAAQPDSNLVASDRRMARRAHAHVSRGEDRENADPFSAAYAAKFGDKQPANAAVAMSPAAAAMVDEADTYVDEFLDDDVMVIDDSMLDEMIVGNVSDDDVLFPDDEAATPAGNMFVGAVDEVELSGPFRSGDEPLAYDPEEVPSEHAEINELRHKMPFG